MDKPPLPIPKELWKAADIFAGAGRQCWLVGGAVRDGFLGRGSDDFDLATDAPPQEVQRIFKRTIPTGMQHGTITILLGKHHFETTTFRCDGSYSDGRRPDSISYADNIQEDLSRRDFTINAIAYDLINHKLVDPHHGQADLRKKTIRAIGNPADRLEEDGLRSIRACRFAGQLGFSIDEQTKSAISSHHANIPGLSAERIWVELKKIMAVPSPSISIELFRQTGLLEVLLPEIHKVAEETPSVYTSCLRASDNAPSHNFPLRLATLFNCLASEPKQAAGLAEKILRRYKSSNNDRERVTRLLQHGGFEFNSLRKDSDIRRFIIRVGKDLLDDLLAFKALKSSSENRSGSDDSELDRMGERIREILDSDNPLSIKELALSGSDLMNLLGVEKGPLIGNLLKFLLDSVLEEPELNNREQLLEIGKSRLETIKRTGSER